MKILFLSHSSLASPFVVGSHHLARGMARLGHEVVHVSPPVTPAHLSKICSEFERTRLLRWWRGGAKCDGVVDIVPSAPFTWGACRCTRYPLQVYGSLVLPSLLRSLRRLRFESPDLVIIDEPRLGYLLKSFPGSRVTYRPTDLYAELRDDDSIKTAERFVIQLSQAFIATSQPVAAHLKLLGVEKPHIVENGVDLELFDVANDIDIETRLPAYPRVVYAGAFDKRFGFETLRIAALAAPNVSFVLIGPMDASKRQALLDLRNVFPLGRISHDILPSFLRRCQLGMLPLSDDESNRGRSPMKLYEYAAAGLPVVSTWTPELARRLLAFVKLTRTSGEFADVITAYFGQPHEFQQIDVSAHGWTAKVREVLNIASGTVT